MNSYSSSLEKSQKYQYRGYYQDKNHLNVSKTHKLVNNYTKTFKSSNFKKKMYPSKKKNDQIKFQFISTVNNGRCILRPGYSSALLVEGIPQKISIQELWECYLEIGPVFQLKMAVSTREAIITFFEPSIHFTLFEKPFWFDEDTLLYLSRHIASEIEMDESKKKKL